MYSSYSCSRNLIFEKVVYLPLECFDQILDDGARHFVADWLIVAVLVPVLQVLIVFKDLKSKKVNCSDLIKKFNISYFLKHN